MGPTPAATVIERMSTTFPDLRCALLVGIGGGIPSKQHDIRLGDVVVGVPGTQHGAVVQWDFGKTIAGGEFIHRGIMHDPPPLLLTAINTLRAQSAFGSPALQTYLSQGIDRLAENERRNFQRPSDSLDLLFEAEYDSQHPQEGGCHDCDKERIVPRTQRAQQQVPIVHFGTIASGNQVIKHGAKRSQIGEQFQALCIEMEAAGVVKNFPCLVIRGICDYSDSHKNKAWQGHAAMAAAALAKHLLSIIPTSNVNTDMEPGAVFLHGTAPIKLTPVSRRDLSRGEGRWWQDYWHMDDIPQRMHPPPDPSQQAFIQEKRRELENSIAELQSAALESNKTTEIKIAEFMAEYYPVVEDQVANFQLPSQRLAVFSAMIRMTKGSLDRDTMSIRTLLHYMAMNGVHEVLPKLVEIGFGLNDTDSDYQTPLHLAVICNHDEAARVLVEDCKADVHVPDLNGLLPWHHALVIDWDNLAENSAREDSKRCIIRLLAKVTDATKVKGTNARRKLIKIQENPQAEIVF
jgi:nucleoside phosphorylase